MDASDRPRRAPQAKYGDPDLLTPQRRLFVDTLFELGFEPGSIKQAFGVAYPSTKLKYRQQQAQALFKEPAIQRAIARQKEELRARHHITLDRLVLETAKIAFGDMRDVASWDEEGGVRVKSSDEISPRGAAMLSELEVFTGRGPAVNGQAERAVTTRTRLKTNSKLKALDQLARLLGYYEIERPAPSAIQLSVDPKELASDVAFLVRAAGAGTPWHRPGEILSLEKVAGPLIDRAGVAAGPAEEELKQQEDDKSGLAVADDSDFDPDSNSKPDLGVQPE